MSEERWPQDLLNILVEKFTEDDVRGLCFSLGLDYDCLGEPAKTSKSDRARALVAFCEERDLGHQLARAMHALRPDLDILVKTVPGQASRSRVEIQLTSDVLFFGSQQRTRLVQDIATRFNTSPEEIHVLTEASVAMQIKGKQKIGTHVVLGMPTETARALVAFCRRSDESRNRFVKDLAVHLVRERHSPWVKQQAGQGHHRQLGILLFLAYIGSLLLLGYGSCLLIQARHYFPAGFTPTEERLAVLGALPSLVVWAALPIIVTLFMQRIYTLGRFRQAFDYMFLLVFGPLIFRYQYVFVQEGKVTGKSQGMPQGRPDGPGGPSLLIVFNDSAVVVERAGHRVGVIGPTVYRAGPFEKIHQVLDLRPQARDMPATLLTRDGIPVKVMVGATFRLRWKGEPTTDKPYPVDPDALFQAAAARTVFKYDQGESVRSWADRLGSSLDVALRGIVARYRLDELLEPPSLSAPARSDLERDLMNSLRAMAANFGAEVTEARLGTFEFDSEEVKKQWMTTWKVGWEGEVRMRKARADAQAIRTREMAHAYAQLEMIAAITREFQRSADNEAIRTDLILLRFVEVIGRMVADPESAIFLPHEALQTLDGVRKMLEEARTTALALEAPAPTESSESVESPAP